jgi:hypothetical protein
VLFYWHHYAYILTFSFYPSYQIPKFQWQESKLLFVPRTSCSCFIHVSLVHLPFSVTELLNSLVIIRYISSAHWITYFTKVCKHFQKTKWQEAGYIYTIIESTDITAETFLILFINPENNSKIKSNLWFIEVSHVVIYAL